LTALALGLGDQDGTSARARDWLDFPELAIIDWQIFHS
jgi:hypothetical protein